MGDKPGAEEPAQSAARYVSWRPAEALSPYVRTVVAYDLVRPAPGTHHGLPSTALTLVLPVGEPLDVGWYGRAGTRAARWSCLSGLHAHPAEIHHPGRQAGIQLALTPLGARGLFGVPAGELSGVLADVGDAAPALADLPERLADARTWHERLRLVQARLLAQLAGLPAVRPRPELRAALRGLSGGSAVSAVAAEVGLSRRRLSDLFRAEYGVTPKQYQRIARFQASRQAVEAQARAGRLSLAGVAADHGYADQAHLTKEWSALAGHTPTAWLRAEFPFVQDAAGDASLG